MSQLEISKPFFHFLFLLPRILRKHWPILSIIWTDRNRWTQEGVRVLDVTTAMGLMVSIMFQTTRIYHLLSLANCTQSDDVSDSMISVWWLLRYKNVLDGWIQVSKNTSHLQGYVELLCTSPATLQALSWSNHCILLTAIVAKWAISLGCSVAFYTHSRDSTTFTTKPTNTLVEPSFLVILWTIVITILRKISNL